MKSLNDSKNYHLSFFESHGGVEEVARVTGMNRQTLRQLMNGRNFPSRSTAAKLKETYTDYAWLPGLIASVPVPVLPVDPSTMILIELGQLRERVNVLSEQLKMKDEENKALREQLQNKEQGKLTHVSGGVRNIGKKHSAGDKATARFQVMVGNGKGRILSIPFETRQSSARLANC